MKIYYFFILVYLFGLIRKSSSLSCDNDDQNEPNNEKRLKNDLFCKYDSYIRPGQSSNATIVSVRLNVKDLDYEDDKNIMTLTSWMTLSWNDSRLIWNSADYGGIGSIHMASSYLWTPELMLYNAHIPSTLGTCHEVDCIISNSSRVACVMPCSHTALCKDIGIKNWPFDVQNCSFTFGSWMKVGEEMNYIADKITLFTKRTKQNNQWKLIDATSRYNRGYYAFTDETFPSISFAFVIERHNGLHQISTIASGIVLICCNLMTFFISPESTMRLILCGSNIIASEMFLDFLYWMIPNCGDKVPRVLTFFDNIQIYATLLLMQGLILKCILSFSEKPPAWMLKFMSKICAIPLSSLLVEQTSKKQPENASELVEHVKHQTSDKLIVQNFVRILDCVFMTLTSLLLSFLFFSLFPKGYLSYNYNPIDILS